MYILDTDFILNLLKNKEENKNLLDKLTKEANSKIYSTNITYYELLKGCHKSLNFQKNKDIMSNFFTKMEIFEFSLACAEKSAEIYSYLEKKGKMIDEADIFIASICLDKNMTIVTNNTNHFSRIPKLNVISP